MYRFLTTHFVRVRNDEELCHFEEWSDEKSTNSLYICPDDGIGRHARLKIWWLQGREGSSPSLGTKWNYLKLVIFFIQCCPVKYKIKSIFCKIAKNTGYWLVFLYFTNFFPGHYWFWFIFYWKMCKIDLKSYWKMCTDT